jgi:hypothetical protein
MQGTIAQIVALTTHGNAILQDAQIREILDFQSRNTTFKFCEWARFSDVPPSESNVGESVYAADVFGWFARLRKEEVSGIRMSYGPSNKNSVPDRTLVGFVGGGGKWLIETYQRDRTYSWEPRWRVGDRERKDKRIWRVAYVRISSSDQLGSGQVQDLAQLKTELRHILIEVAQFSRSQNLDNFTTAFESGIVRLDSRSPFEDLYHDDLAPAGFLSLDACQLLGSVEAAWVFGGMGSWNDVYFEEKERARYDDLSEKLYRLLNQALVAAANSRSVSF